MTTMGHVLLFLPYTLFRERSPLQLIVGGSVTVWLVSCFTSLDLNDSLRTKITYFLYRSNPVWRPAIQ